jgi:RNA recognition motif-containing protein
MAKKLYVGNLSYDTTSDSLQAAFAQAGTVVSCQVIMDKMTGRSKGFGFVEMSTDEEAQAAIDMWNAKELDGRPLTVNEARPMEPRAPRGGGDFGNKGNW